MVHGPQRRAVHQQSPIGESAAAVYRAMHTRIVIGGRMDDERGTISVKQRAGSAGRREEAGTWQGYGGAKHPIGRDLDIGQVARMRPGGIAEAVLVAGRVPMPSGAGEVRRVATADAMNVDAVDPVRLGLEGGPQKPHQRGPHIRPRPVTRCLENQLLFVATSQGEEASKGGTRAGTRSRPLIAVQ